MTGRTVLILAAGKGTRMKSAKPKVLHEVAGLAMLCHVLNAAASLKPGRIVVVTAADADAVADAARAHMPATAIAVQESQNGTGDAVRIGLAALEEISGEVLVLYGDTPLISGETLGELSAARAEAKADIAILGFEALDPTGYGRLITDENGAVTAIREEADASEEERMIPLCNSGVMAFDAACLKECLAKLDDDNAKGELYLTDCVALAADAGRVVATAFCSETEVQGVNTRAQLALCERAMQDHLRARAMAGGVTLIDPGSVTMSHDTEFGEDVEIEPHVVIKNGVTIASGATIKGFCHLEHTAIGENAVIGPFARLRPGADIGADVKIGNFVEVKAARLDRGAKVNHLSYIGDAEIGKAANIGAGTITCNYDGYDKHKTVIGEGAFIGSNTALIAPVTIGAGAVVGAGSAVAQNVAADALALTRAELNIKPGWAQARRARRKTASTANNKKAR